MYIEQQATISSEVVAYFLSLAKRTDLAPGPGGSRITPVEVGPIDLGFPILERPSKVMFVVLYPSSQLVGHKDPPILGRRYHIPIQINDGCWYFHDGVWQQLEIGKAYLMDPTKEHGAVNWGSEIRIHLIADTTVR